MKKFYKNIRAILSVACVVLSAILFISCSNDDDEEQKTEVVNTGFSGSYWYYGASNQFKETTNNSFAEVKVLTFTTDGNIKIEAVTSKVLPAENDGEEDLVLPSTITDSGSYTKNGSNLTWTETDAGSITAEITENGNLKIGEKTFTKTTDSIYARAEISTSDKSVMYSYYLLKDDSTYKMMTITYKANSNQRELEVDTDEENGTYEISGSTITLTKPNAGETKTATIEGTKMTFAGEPAVVYTKLK